jgi:cytoskeletal protein CcmA (bactofilin family)
MFGRRKDEGGDENPQEEPREEATAPLPLRSRTAQPAQNLTPAAPAARAPVARPEAARRVPEMPGAIGRRPDQPGGDDAKKLIVGREIFLNGEINSCDRLVVEGRVEANMNDCHEIEIAESGTFKGQAEIDRADISGVFEGDLTAREHLVVRATGRITGKVRFGELEIERGGQIVGDVQVFGESVPASHEAQFAADTTAECFTDCSSPVFNSGAKS